MVSEKECSGLCKNMVYESDLPPGFDVPITQQPIVLAIPPPDTQGIFLNSDAPVIIQPSRAGFDTSNRFTIYDENDQVLFYALESSNCLVRQLCGPSRPFKMKILDVYQNEVMRIDRPLACKCCICYCCLMNVEVSCPRGNVVGKAQQEFSWLYPKIAIENALGEKVLSLDGPWWTCSCGEDINFKVSTADGTQVAELSKTWAGCCQEYFTDADNFTISFDRSLDPTIKATILGAVFLLDVMYFERRK